MMSELGLLAIVTGAVSLLSFVTGKKAKAEAEKRELEAKAERQRLQKEADIERQKQWEKDAPIREAQEAARRIEQLRLDEEDRFWRVRRNRELAQAEAAGHDVCYVHSTIDNLCSRCNRPMCCNGGEYYPDLCYSCDDGG